MNHRVTVGRRFTVRRGDGRGRPRPLSRAPAAQFGVMPAALMIGTHFSISALW